MLHPSTLRVVEADDTLTRLIMPHLVMAPCAELAPGGVERVTQQRPESLRAYDRLPMRCKLRHLLVPLAGRIQSERGHAPGVL